ncbi:MAG TPA: LacI family DNA-binding transcriptional regulator [Clostridia bacterium]
MQKRPTNKDVARMAGVSVATVSYVINGVKDKHVSEATRKKVLHAINFLNYSPNLHAVNLSSKNVQNIIAVRTSKSTCFWQEVETLCFLQHFSKALSQQNDNHILSYLPDKSVAQINADACLCIDFSREEFYALSNENFIPIIVVDSLLDDPVFYQVIFDYAKMKTAAQTYFNSPYTFICPDLANAELKKSISEIFDDVLFYHDLSDAVTLKPKHKNILIAHSSLLGLFEKTTEYNVYKYVDENIYDKRAKSILNCIQNAINRTAIQNPEHFIKI